MAFLALASVGLAAGAALLLAGFGSDTMPTSALAAFTTVLLLSAIGCAAGAWALSRRRREPQSA